IQHALGVDIIHPLDECLAYPSTREATERSLALTLRWARRSQAVHAAAPSAAALFGIVQGGAWEDLRERAVDETVALGFDGYAIGGMAGGETQPMMYALTAAGAARLPPHPPGDPLGGGEAQGPAEAVGRGGGPLPCRLSA